MYKKLATAALTILALTLSLNLLQGCVKREEIDPRTREYVKGELATLLDLMFYVDEMNPSSWTEQIYPRDDGWDVKAVGTRIEESLKMSPGI